MSDLLLLERAIASSLQPLMGERATGTVRLYASSEPVALTLPTYCVPVITSAGGQPGLDFHRMLKIREPITVEPEGTDVPCMTALGGAGMGIGLGELVRVNPSIPGLEVTGEVVAPFVAQPDANPLEEPGAIRRVVTWEALGTRSQAEAFWKAAAGLFPCVVIGWEGWDVGGKQGRGSQTHDNTFGVYVVTNRRDGAHERRDEGKAVLQAVAELLLDRTGVDGEQVSKPPTTLGRASLFTQTPEAYVYRLDVFATATITKRHAPGRGAPWLTTRERFQTTPATDEQDPDRLLVVDQTQAMPQTPEEP